MVLHRCPVCPKEYLRKGELIRHLQSHNFDDESDETPNKSLFQCTNCSKEYISNCNLQKHYKNKFCGKLESLKDIQCPVCPERFLLHSDLKKHLKQKRLAVHPNGTYPCPTCAMKFVYKYGLQQHKCPESTTRRKCKKCSVMFYQGKNQPLHRCSMGNEGSSEEDLNSENSHGYSNRQSSHYPYTASLSINKPHADVACYDENTTEYSSTDGGTTFENGDNDHIDCKHFAACAAEGSFNDGSMPNKFEEGDENSRPIFSEGTLKLLNEVQESCGTDNKADETSSDGASDRGKDVKSESNIDSSLYSKGTLKMLNASSESCDRDSSDSSCGSEAAKPGSSSYSKGTLKMLNASDSYDSDNSAGENSSNSSEDSDTSVNLSRLSSSQVEGEDSELLYERIEDTPENPAVVDLDNDNNEVTCLGNYYGEAVEAVGEAAISDGRNLPGPGYSKAESEEDFVLVVDVAVQTDAERPSPNVGFMPEVPRNMRCPLCPQRFIFKAELNRHAVMKHNLAGCAYLKSYNAWSKESKHKRMPMTSLEDGVRDVGTDMCYIGDLDAGKTLQAADTTFEESSACSEVFNATGEPTAIKTEMIEEPSETYRYIETKEEPIEIDEKPQLLDFES